MKSGENALEARTSEKIDSVVPSLRISGVSGFVFEFFWGVGGRDLGCSGFSLGLLTYVV